MQLQTPSDRVRFLWDIHSKGPPSAVERQSLLINTKGYSLLDCKSTLELFECIKHAVIGESEMQYNSAERLRIKGWLIHFLNGSLHRDISIGNILKTDKADRKDHSNFTYPESFEDDLKELDKRNATKSGEDAKLWEDMQKAKIEVEKLLKAEFSPASSCTAFVADIDQGIPTDLLCKSHNRSWEEPPVSRSSIDSDQLLRRLKGTVQFMSHQVLLRLSIERSSNSFLQSPADDLETFLYVALWAIFFNEHTSKKLSEDEEIFKSKLLLKDTRETGVRGCMAAPSWTLSSSPLTKEAQPIMEEWNDKQFKLYKQIRERAMIDVAFVKDVADSLWRRSVGWILCALSGVMMIETIINSQLENLKKYPEFESRIP